MLALPEIIHLGGEKSVTGSCHLLRTSEQTIMIDCGMVQGNDKSMPMENWPVKPAEIDYLFLTHAHIDHIGRLPELIANGFSGEIICSHPTKALLSPMLQDAMKFITRDKRKIASTLQTIDQLSWGFEYQQTFNLKNNVTFSLGHAGHILGSCFIRFTIPGTFTNTQQANEYSIIFSGDLGNKDTPILQDPDIPTSCDLLILESTYGDKLHPDRSNRIENLEHILINALKDNGKIFIPAFSLGRTQELLYELDRIYSRQAALEKNSDFNIQSIPVFIDSPLGLSITSTYSSLSQFWDKESKELARNNDHPFDFQGLYSSKNFKEHIKLLELDGPAIIIAGSGMCTGGRILNHLMQGLENPANDILFIGYQASGTLGRKIIQYSKKHQGYVFIKGNKVRLKAQVKMLNGYSAHADQQGLLQWVNAMPQKPGAIKLVHGESGAQQALTVKLNEHNHTCI